jgi:hypothetical protein
MKKQNIDHKREGAFTSMNPLGSLPNRGLGSTKNLAVLDNDVKRCNRYLEWQSKRIYRFVASGRIQAALLVWCLLAKNSKAYQLALYHKVNKSWYWKQSEKDVWEELKYCMNKFRTWNLRTYITRYYLLKKNGKYRPIGSPDLPSKMIGRFLSDLCTYTLDGPRSGLEVSNHAYRPLRGRHTAVIEILENWVNCLIKYKKVPIIKEIDFQAYFNNVNWRSILVSLNRLTNSDLSSLVLMFLKNTKTRLPQRLQEESELLLVGENKGKPVIVRKGLPQGSPVSPVLATVACDMSAPPRGLTMYADDGVFVGNDLKAFDKWLEDGEESGRIISHEKTRVLDKNEPLKFCGYTIDFNLNIITNEFGEGIDLFTPRDELERFLKKGNQGYGEVPRKKKRWEWDVHYNAFCVNTKISIFDTGWITPLIWFFGIFRLEYKGYKWIPFRGVYSVTTTSSESMKLLIRLVKATKNLSELKLVRDLRFDFNDEVQLVKSPKNMKSHLEFNPMRLSPGVQHLVPGISTRDLLLSTRSTIGSANYVKVTWQELAKKMEEK